MDLPPIWEEVAPAKGRMEGLATLNKTLLMPPLHFWRLFGGRAQFIASLPILAFVKNASIY